MLRRNRGGNSPKLTDIPSLVTQAWEDRRSPSSFAGLAAAMNDLIRRLPPEEREMLGWSGPATLHQNSVNVLATLAEMGNVRLIYEGRTPKKETRPFICGDASGPIAGVVVVLGVYPAEVELTHPDVDVYYITPEPAVLGQAQWSRQPLSRGLLEALFSYAPPVQPKPEPEPEPDKPAEKPKSKKKKPNEPAKS